MDVGTRTTIAVSEAREFYGRLTRQTLGAQLTMLAILILMDYFDASIKSIVIAGLFLATGTVATLIMDTAKRLDAGRAYLEMWCNDTDTTLGELARAVDEFKLAKPIRYDPDIFA